MEKQQQKKKKQRAAKSSFGGFGASEKINFPGPIGLKKKACMINCGQNRDPINKATPNYFRKLTRKSKRE